MRRRRGDLSVAASFLLLSSLGTTTTAAATVVPVGVHAVGGRGGGRAFGRGGHLSPHSFPHSRRGGGGRRAGAPLLGPEHKPGGIYGEGSPKIHFLGHHPAMRRHRPASPNFGGLISEMRPIIPAQFGPGGTGGDGGQALPGGGGGGGVGFKRRAGFRSGRLPGARGSSGRRNGQELLFLRNVLRMVGEMVPKMKEEGPAGQERIALLEEVEKKAKEILENIETSGGVPKKAMSELVVLFNRAFAETELPDRRGKGHRMLGGGGLSRSEDAPTQHLRAPFCAVGDDCFEDVNHPQIAMDIKRLALALSVYMKNRMVEEKAGGGNPNSPRSRFLRGRSSFAQDAVMTQAIALIARLHRAVLRNWHHMRMILHNLAGAPPMSGATAAGAATGVASAAESNQMAPRNSGSVRAAAPLPKYEFFQCRVHVKGKGEQFKERPHWCRAGKSWFKDKACKSPIRHPQTECAPEVSSGLYFEKVHGQYALTLPYSGQWDFSVKASVMPSAVDEIQGEHIRGSVDKILMDKDKKSESKGIQTMAVLDQTAKFPRKTEKGTKVYMEAAGSGSFKRGERLLLRTAMSKEDIMITFTVRYNPKKTAEKGETTKRDTKDNEGEKEEEEEEEEEDKEEGIEDDDNEDEDMEEGEEANGEDDEDWNGDDEEKEGSGDHREEHKRDKKKVEEEDEKEEEENNRHLENEVGSGSEDEYRDEDSLAAHEGEEEEEEEEDRGHDNHQANEEGGQEGGGKKEGGGEDVYNVISS